MRQNFETFSVGVLNLLANAGVVIPYFFCLMLYTQNSGNPVYALPFLMLYTFRCIGMLLTVYINWTAATMLNVSNVTGIIGSLSMLFAGNPFFGILGGILLGLSSSWIWPYFLTMRSRGKLDENFKITINHWMAALVAMIILVAIGYLSDKMQILNLAFGFLAIVFVFSWFGGIYMKRQIDFYSNSDYKISIHNPSKLVLALIFLVVLVILMFSIRYTRLTNTSSVMDLLICLLAVIVLATLIYFQLDIHRKIFPLSLAALTRGVVMNFVLLYSIFDSTLRFKFNSTMIIFVIYMVGFELGPTLLKKFTEWRYPVLIIGIIFTMWDPTYFFGLLLCAIFIGADNVILNDSLYTHPNLNGERAFLIKYQLSSVGNISQQLIYMSVIYILSFAMNVKVLSFFDKSVSGATYSLLTNIHLFISIWIIFVSAITYYSTRRFKLSSK
ncbi:hypothetical protein [Companilactobacillus ginsenosidimutans]|uniref:MFS transporter n=1 Tax=Companilactobacillus ginsenosidimutans TaxID=1007676 RepID=A0A0H4QFI0_9LACO|nr:hypothetical protein [Companilactobacillus ginsenosidimutans]AKP67169.1 hypothetical protein ABM34_06215 [Companilactobacillus ginsenosidimutans]